MTDIVASDAVMALIQVVMIDLVLAGDNAVVIGLAAAGLPAKQRKRAIIIGILTATALRIACASIATQLLQVFGLLLAGGILLLWVCWKMWRELQTTPKDQQGGDETLVAYAPGRNETVAGSLGRKTFGQATLQIVVADFSRMSLDNASWLRRWGGARASWRRPCFLGLLLSIAPGWASAGRSLIARLLQQAALDRLMSGYARVVLYVACEMIYRGCHYELSNGDQLAGVMLQMTRNTEPDKNGGKS